MKKVIISGLLFITLGFFIGKFIFKEPLISHNKNQEKYYFLQEGVYQNKDNLNNNLTDITQKIVDYNDNKYYVYVGITKDLKVAEKIMKIYEKEGLNIHLKEKTLSSEEFSANVSQFDLLINDTTDSNQVLTIEEVVLANYEEIIKKR